MNSVWNVLYLGIRHNMCLKNYGLKMTPDYWLADGSSARGIKHNIIKHINSHTVVGVPEPLSKIQWNILTCADRVGSVRDVHSIAATDGELQYLIMVAEDGPAEQILIHPWRYFYDWQYFYNDNDDIVTVSHGCWRVASDIRWRCPKNVRGRRWRCDAATVVEECAQSADDMVLQNTASVESARQPPTVLHYCSGMRAAVGATALAAQYIFWSVNSVTSSKRPPLRYGHPTTTTDARFHPRDDSHFSVLTSRSRQRREFETNRREPRTCFCVNQQVRRRCRPHTSPTSIRWNNRRYVGIIIMWETELMDCTRSRSPAREPWRREP